jgi:arylsulfatase A-like enzyme
MTYFKENWKPVRKSEHHFTEYNTQKKLNGQRQDYDRFIAYIDAEFGRFYDFLGETGFLENTTLMVTSDHGEMFERGILGHETATMYEPILHIPLLISKPGQSKREDIFTTTNAVDVLPTLLQVAGQSLPGWCEGQVLPGFNGPSPLSDRSVFAVEAKQNPKMAPLQKATYAMMKEPYKLIYYTGYPGFDEVYELYNLEEDPEELVNLYSSSDPVASSLIDELKAKLTQIHGG